jgi:muramoyltetrapeptide carboxypeptidase LdcA involved in peptidoglycan recycling
MKKFQILPKLNKDDQVAVLSPSSGLPGIFPWVFDLGLNRLEKDFNLIPKEYPTTRQMNSTLEDRAKDIISAFKDKSNKAIFSSIGGFDQLLLIKLLPPEVFIENPKPFFGFSDNTHLVNYLWNLGIPAYFGGSIMTQFAFQGGMQAMTTKYLKHALFNTGEIELEVSSEYNDEGLPWADENNLVKIRKMDPNLGLRWDGDKDAKGLLWGGTLESINFQLSISKYLPKDSDLDGCVLYLETSEELPQEWLVMYTIMAMGERGWFKRFSAVMVGRPKAWTIRDKKTVEEKAEYILNQQETIIRAIRSYDKTMPVIQNLDFGHTDPQIVIPSGNLARISSKDKKIYLTY